MASRPHPPPRPHGALDEVFPGVFFVTGTMRFPGPVPVLISRNMTVLRDGSSLTVVNSVRLDDEGLAALDALGRVEHVVRLAGFHGADDPFFKERYGATVWNVGDQPYAAGFNPRPPPDQRYFQPDQTVNDGDELPGGGRVIAFSSVAAGEGLLHLDRDGGLLVAGDVLQNWAEPDGYFNTLGRWSLRAMGFVKPCNVGPGWLKQMKPAAPELRRLLDLPFEHLLPAHGTPVVGQASVRYRPALEAAVAWAEKDGPPPAGGG